jgi:hypothetical protein
VTATGAVTQTGVLTVAGTTSVSAGANPITLNNTGNDFAGAVTVDNTGANAVLLDDSTALTVDGAVGGDLTTSAGATIFGPSATTVGGNLGVTATGAVSQTGALTVDGTTSVSAGANPITLNNAGNELAGAVTVNNTGANDVSLDDGAALTVNGAIGGNLTTFAGATTFGPGATAVGGNLDVTATGAVSQTGVLTVDGTTSVSAGANPITLNNAGNDLAGVVTFNNTGANAVTLDDSVALTLNGAAGGNLTTSAGATTFGTTTVGGNLGVTATGAVSQTGVLTVDGTTSVSAGANPITLNNAGNDFAGAVTVDNTGANAVSLDDSTALTLNGAVGGNLTTSAGATIFGTTTVGGDLGVTATGAVTQTGVLTVDGTTSVSAGANPITLNNTGNDFAGAVTVDNTGANAVLLDDSTALTVDGAVGGNLTTSAEATTFGPSATTVGGNLGVTATGAVSQTGALTVDGTTSLNVGANPITLNNTGNDFVGTVTVDNTGANAVSLDSSGALTVDAAVGGNLTTSAGATTFGPTVTTVGGNLDVTATTLVVDGNLTANNITFNNSGLATISANITAAGDLAFSGNGDVIVNNSISAASVNDSEATTLDFAATQNSPSVVTTGDQAYTGTVTLGADAILNATTVELADVTGGGHSLTVNNTGTATFNGAVTGLSTLSISGASDLSGSAVTTTGDQTYNGAVTVGADETLSSTSDGEIEFISTVDGAHSLTINAATTIFDESVGKETALASLTVTGKTLDINSKVHSIRTSGTQDYSHVNVFINLPHTAIGQQFTFSGSQVSFESPLGPGQVPGVVELPGGSSVSVDGQVDFSDGQIGPTTGLFSAQSQFTGRLPPVQANEVDLQPGLLELAVAYDPNTVEPPGFIVRCAEVYNEGVDRSRIVGTTKTPSPNKPESHNPLR